MRMMAMKPYLTPILIILLLISGIVVGCGQKQSTAGLVAYLNEELPIIERHNETVGRVVKAVEAITSEAAKPATPKDKSVPSSKTQMEAIEHPTPIPPFATSLNTMSERAIRQMLQATPVTPQPIIPGSLKEALISGVSILDSELSTMDSVILDYKRLNPPAEAKEYHYLVVSYLEAIRAAWDGLSSYYRTILTTGYGDEKKLSRAHMLQLEARINHLEAKLELLELHNRQR